MPIGEKKWDELKKRMEMLHIEESDIEEKFTLGSGKGGQKVNKTASAVSLFYAPRKMQVKCQKSRSREENRFFARRLLVEKVEQETLGKKSPTSQKQENLRKQKKRRKRRHLSANMAPGTASGKAEDQDKENLKLTDT